MVREAQEALYINTVIPLIKESGLPIQLTYTSADTNEPFVGYVAGTLVTEEGDAVETDFKADSVPETIAPKVVKTIMVIFDSADVMSKVAPPKADRDKVIMDGSTYKVLYVQKTQPGHVLFFYTLFLGA